MISFGVIKNLVVTFRGPSRLRTPLPPLILLAIESQLNELNYTLLKGSDSSKWRIYRCRIERAPVEMPTILFIHLNYVSCLNLRLNHTII